jgi:(4S)-4-hydroxy-5-phosphonooxypentane-2,3-dione isomerase
MYVVTVLFNIHKEHWQPFKKAMQTNAQTSLEVEPGCHQFDVCEGDPGSHSIFLYEVYATPNDFADHLKAAHFLAFNELTAPWVVDKQVRIFSRT